jgi:hypothetical protein
MLPMRGIGVGPGGSAARLRRWFAEKAQIRIEEKSRATTSLSAWRYEFNMLSIMRDTVCLNMHPLNMINGLLRDRQDNSDLHNKP